MLARAHARAWVAAGRALQRFLCEESGDSSLQARSQSLLFTSLWRRAMLTVATHCCFSRSIPAQLPSIEHLRVMAERVSAAGFVSHAHIIITVLVPPQGDGCYREKVLQPLVT